MWWTLFVNGLASARYQRIRVASGIDLFPGAINALEILFDQDRQGLSGFDRLVARDGNAVRGEPFVGRRGRDLDPQPVVLIGGLGRGKARRGFHGVGELCARRELGAVFDKTGLAELGDFRLAQPEPQRVSMDAEFHWILDAPE